LPRPIVLRRARQVVGGNNLHKQADELRQRQPSTSCLWARSLYPQKRPFAALPRNDVMGQSRHVAPQKKVSLFAFSNRQSLGTSLPEAATVHGSGAAHTG
jgi:hypothetical protein